MFLWCREITVFIWERIRLVWWVKWDLSRDLLRFYRMNVFEMVKNCWLCPETLGFLCGEWGAIVVRNLDGWTVSINWVNLFGLWEMGAWFWCDFWCYFWDGAMRGGRDLLGFYDTMVDTMREWWKLLDGRDLLG